MNDKVQTHEFQAEVREVLRLMVHSLYSNKEIFLRELVSNASDACDRLRFEALKDSSLLEGDPELRIEIEIDSDACRAHPGKAQVSRSNTEPIKPAAVRAFLVSEMKRCKKRRTANYANYAN